MVRQRHPALAYQRETHVSSAINFGQPSDTLYGSQMDLEAVTVVDLGQGSVTDGAIVDGGLDGGTAIRDGTLPPSSFDQTPPSDPTAIDVTSQLVTEADGDSVVAIVVSLIPPTDEDYFATYVEYTSVNDEDPVVPKPLWLRPQVQVMGKDQYVAYLTGVSGATQYWVRLYSVDVQGNRTEYIPPPPDGFPVLTVGDTVPPDIPQGTTAAPGYKAIGVRWNPTAVVDLMFNEVRFCKSVNGIPDLAWDIRRTRNNSLFVDDLVGGVSYWAQVRSVDYSKNVMARWAATGLASTNVFTCVTHTFANGDKVYVEDYSGGAGLEAVRPLYVIAATATTFQVSGTVGGAAVDFTTDFTGFVGYDPQRAVDYTVQPESGWAPMVGPTEAQLVGESDIAFHGIIAEIIDAGHINAGQIEAGVLTISTAAGTADGIKVMSGTKEVGSWDDTGLRIRSKSIVPNDRSMLDYIWLDDAGLTIVLDGNPVSAITEEGISADAITFGTAEGGHNLVWNSSFELSRFLESVTSPIGTGGFTFAGGVGGWSQVTTNNATVTATQITMAAL